MTTKQKTNTTKANNKPGRPTIAAGLQNLKDDINHSINRMDDYIENVDERVVGLEKVIETQQDEILTLQQIYKEQTSINHEQASVILLLQQNLASLASQSLIAYDEQASKIKDLYEKLLSITVVLEDNLASSAAPVDNNNISTYKQVSLTPKEREHYESLLNKTVPRGKKIDALKKSPEYEALAKTINDAMTKITKSKTKIEKGLTVKPNTLMKNEYELYHYLLQREEFINNALNVLKSNNEPIVRDDIKNNTEPIKNNTERSGFVPKPNRSTERSGFVPKPKKNNKEPIIPDRPFGGDVEKSVKSTIVLSQKINNKGTGKLLQRKK